MLTLRDCSYIKAQKSASLILYKNSVLTIMTTFSFSMTMEISGKKEIENVVRLRP